MAEPTTRERLLQIGLDRIHAFGYAPTGVKEILDLAGVPKGSFYHYFPSKESFTQEVLARYVARETEHCQRVLFDDAVVPLQRLHTYFNELVALYGQTSPIAGCLIGNLSLEIAAHNPNLQPLLSAAFLNWQQGVSAILRAAVDQGELPPSTNPDQLASFLLNSWEGALVRSKADNSDQPLETFLHYTFNVLLK
jgi:TetR/AcrR family transcriptional repressor of nem operon